MIRETIRTVVFCPLPDVFAYLADFGNLPAYDPWVCSVEPTSAGPTGVGSTWRHTRVQGRRQIEAPIELIEYEPNRRVAIQSGSKGFDVSSVQSFAAVGEDATEVTEVLEMRLRGMVRLFEPIIRRQVPKQSAKVHARLKEILEASP